MEAIIRREVGGVIYETLFKIRSEVTFQEGEACYFAGTKYWIRKIHPGTPPLIELERYDRTKQD